MSNSMKDLLLGLGFKPAPATKADERRDAPRPRTDGATTPRASDRHRADRAGQAHIRPAQARPAQRTARSSEEIDLGKAYALRAQREKDERIEAERLKQDAARRKREAKAKVIELLHGKLLVTPPDAACVRHFEYNGKIRRVHVNPAQLKALNAGELAVIQLDGRYLLVDAAVALQVQELLPSLVALRIDPDAPVADDPYADPKFAIPDDLTW
ncbi:MAG: DUF2058 family protein [Proteobacteria bacterium]|nr:DUF2058 family protein [Pseudomonadota bacterium]